MRKRCLLLLLVAGLLCGCHPASESGGTTDYAGDLSKAQEIAVIPASAAAPTQVLTTPPGPIGFRPRPGPGPLDAGIPS